MNHPTWPIAVLGSVAILFVMLLMLMFTEPRVAVRSFDECVQAGNPVMESYPRQCQSADGTLFVETL